MTVSDASTFPRHQSLPSREHYPLVIIGSGAGGVSAARSYLDADGPGPVLMITEDIDPPYERPPLSKEVLSGEKEPTGDPVNGEGLPDGVELLLASSISAVDIEKQTVAAKSWSVEFDRLIVATGARSKSLHAAQEGAEIHLLRSLDDARTLVASARTAYTALVIGSGFIGCEAAASLAQRGLNVALVTPENGPQEQRLGAAASSRIKDWLEAVGVEVRTGRSVKSVAAPRVVQLDDGTSLNPDLILAAVGVTPGGTLLDNSPAEVRGGRIMTDQHLKAHATVWVAGDSALAQHGVAGRPIMVEHWGDALAMGEIAGHNAAVEQNAQKSWDSIPGFWSIIGDHTLKYSAWGDGFSTAEFRERPDGFVVWYGDERGELVGVLTYNSDDDYERGQHLLEQRAPLSHALK